MSFVREGTGLASGGAGLTKVLGLLNVVLMLLPPRSVLSTTLNLCCCRSCVQVKSMESLQIQNKKNQGIVGSKNCNYCWGNKDSIAMFEVVD